MDLGNDNLHGKVLVVESQCRGDHDVVPAARQFAQELRRLWFNGYDVRGVTIKGILVRNDDAVIPTSNLVLVDGELIEKQRQCPRIQQGRSRPERP